jgi:curved DNA-binding protein CbpA
MQELNDAYAIISDPAQRAVYDRERQKRLNAQRQAEVVDRVEPGGWRGSYPLPSSEAIQYSMNGLRDDGVVILVAECREGCGDNDFRDWMMRFRNPAEMEKEIRKRTSCGANRAYSLANALDNAKIYRSPQLARIAASLGIVVIHTPPYQPEGRGKIERFFRRVRDQFLANLNPKQTLL